MLHILILVHTAAPLSIHKVFTALQCGFGGAAHLMGNATKFVPGLIKPWVGGGRGQKPKSKACIFMPIALMGGLDHVLILILRIKWPAR